MPSKELEAKSTTPPAGLVITPTKPLPTPSTHNTSFYQNDISTHGSAGLKAFE